MTIKVKDLAKGDKVSGLYLLAALTRKERKTGDGYLEVTLQDGTGTIKANYWDAFSSGLTNEYYESLGGKIVHVTGDVTEYNSKLQMTLKTMRQTTEADGEVKLQDYIAYSFRPASEALRIIDSYIDRIEDDKLRQVVNTIVDSFRAQLDIAPAAKAMHHQQAAGLVNHTAEMLATADSIYQNFSFYGDLLNPSVGFAAIILHDMYKVIEMDFDPNTGVVSDYTVKGQLLGHIYMGTYATQIYCQKYGVSPELSLAVTHALLAHHGQLEYGSPVKPQTMDALIVNLCDGVSAELNKFAYALLPVESGEISSRIFTLGHSVYKPSWSTKDGI